MIARVLTQATRLFTLGEIHLGMGQTGVHKTRSREVHSSSAEGWVGGSSYVYEVSRAFYRRSPSDPRTPHGPTSASIAPRVAWIRFRGVMNTAGWDCAVDDIGSKVGTFMCANRPPMRESYVVSGTLVGVWDLPAELQRT